MDCCVALQTKVVPCQHVVLQTANRSMCHVYVARLTRCWTTTRMRKKLRRKRQNPSRRLWRCDLKSDPVTGKFLIQGSSIGERCLVFICSYKLPKFVFAQFLRRLMSGRMQPHFNHIFRVHCRCAFGFISQLFFADHIRVMLTHPIPLSAVSCWNVDPVSISFSLRSFNTLMYINVHYIVHIKHFFSFSNWAWVFAQWLPPEMVQAFNLAAALGDLAAGLKKDLKDSAWRGPAPLPRESEAPVLLW